LKTTLGIGGIVKNGRSNGRSDQRAFKMLEFDFRSIGVELVSDWLRGWDWAEIGLKREVGAARAIDGSADWLLLSKSYGLVILVSEIVYHLRTVRGDGDCCGRI
jgi:hypothetical protein